MSSSTLAPDSVPRPAPAGKTGGERTWLARARQGLGSNVYVLGAVSFFTDVSSEMVMPLRFVFLVLVLGTSLPVAGLIEGVAETTASLLKVVSGRLADRVARRKPLLVAGYGISNGVKPLLALASGWPAVLGITFVDRVGKGVRGSPRDAMLAEASDPAHRGKAFGLHRAMDTLGAAVGPLLALLIISRAPEADQQSLEVIRRVFAWTVVPGLLSVLVLLFFLRERQRRPKTGEAVLGAAGAGAAATAQAPVAGRGAALAEMASLGGAFWLFAAISTLFALGNSSDAFLFLRTLSIDLWLESVPLIYFGYNVVYALLATPLGVLSDRYGRVPVLVAGYGAFTLVYLGWAAADTGWHTWVLFLVYGVYAAATEGVGKALVVDLVPRARRGTALGWFNGLTGFAALPANVVAGLVWSRFGPGSTFLFGAGCGLLATAALALSERRLRAASRR